MMTLWNMSMIIRENIVTPSIPGCIAFNMKVYTVQAWLCLHSIKLPCKNITIIPCNHFDSILQNLTQHLPVLSFHRDGPRYTGQLGLDRLHPVKYY